MGGGGEIFRTHPDRPWGPPSLLYGGYRVSFPEVKWLELGVSHPPPSSTEVKESVDPVVERNLPHLNINLKLSHYRPGQALGVPGG